MPTSDEDTIRRYEKRIEMNDANEIHNVGVYYSQGLYGLPQDCDKALELYKQAVQRVAMLSTPQPALRG